MFFTVGGFSLAKEKSNDLSSYDPDMWPMVANICWIELHGLSRRFMKFWSILECVPIHLLRDGIMQRLPLEDPFHLVFRFPRPGMCWWPSRPDIVTDVLFLVSLRDYPTDCNSLRIYVFKVFLPVRLGLWFSGRNKEAEVSLRRLGLRFSRQNYAIWDESNKNEEHMLNNKILPFLIR